MGEWRTIDSAPKDGTRILCFDPSEWIPTNIAVTHFCETCWIREHDEDTPYWNPTHWQPLPEPPQ